MQRIDLNADMGEGIGFDEALLDIVSSANISCGLHAGSVKIMSDTMKIANKNGVIIGAHPSYDDYENFGRMRMNLTKDELTNLIIYQISAMQAVARAQNTPISYLKLHGALANMAAEDLNIAKTCYQAALAINPELIMMVMPRTQQEIAAQQMGCPMAREIFADRAYQDDARLVDRKEEGAVLHDAKIISNRLVEMIQKSAIISQSGKAIPTKIDSICLHGDTKGAVEIARQIREALENANIEIKSFV